MIELLPQVQSLRAPVTSVDLVQARTYSNQNVNETATMQRFRNRLIVIVTTGLNNFGLDYRNI